MNNCGICDRGCRYESVKCTGRCKKWYHVGCVNITNSAYKSMCKEKDVVWTCSACKLRNKLGVKDSAYNDEMKELKDKIIALGSSQEDDLDTSLHLAAEAGNALLAENNLLKQELCDLKRDILKHQLQTEENLKYAKDEIERQIVIKMEQEKKFIAKINTLNDKVDLGLRHNEEIILQSENDKINLTAQIGVLNKEILAFKSIIKHQKLEISNLTPTESESDIIQDLRLELKTKAEIIKVIKEDLDQATKKQCTMSKKYEDLQSFINTELNKFTKAKKPCINPRIRPSEQIPIELANRFSILDKDFPVLNAVGTDRLSDSSRKSPETAGPEHTNNLTICENTVMRAVRTPRLSNSSRKSPEITKKTATRKSYLRTESMLPSASPPPTYEKQVVPNVKNKILILADSHGRNLSYMLKNELNNDYEVSSIFHPNASLNQVTKDISVLVSTFTKKDFVIVIGGTNDLEKNVTFNFDQCLKHITDCTSHTNLILTNIPPRFDKYIHDTLHMRLNSKLQTFSQHCSHMELVDLMVLERKDFTNHGLHLNYKGKTKLIKSIYEVICKDVSRIQITSNEDQNRFKNLGNQRPQYPRSTDDQHFLYMMSQRIKSRPIV